MKYLLFTSSACTSCPAMKRNLAQAGIEYQEFDSKDFHKTIKVKGYFIKSVPTFIVADGETVIESLTGVRPVSELVEIRERYQCPK